MGPVTQPVEGGRAEQLVGESFTSFLEVEVGGDDGGVAFIALRNQIVQIFWSCPCLVNSFV